MGFLKAIFGGGGGIVGAVEKLGLEFIETNMEKAEAQAVAIKAIDPNGKMRRDLSTFASRAYGFYLVVTVGLIFMSVWSVGGEVCSQTAEFVEVCTSRADIAAGRMTELFLPITGSWAAIVSASFGVNGVNSYKGVV